MGRVGIESVTLRRAGFICLLGFCANALSNSTCSSPFTIHIGDVFLFMVAAAFGPVGAFIGILCAAIPYGLLVDSAHYSLQTATLLLGIGYAKRHISRVPPFIVVVVSWALLIGPLLQIFPPFKGTLPVWYEEATIFSCLSDTLLALVAGALLLNNTIWCMMTGRPKRTLPVELMLHVMPLCTVLTFFVAIATLQRVGMINPQAIVQSNVGAVLGLLSMTLLIPAALALRIADIVRRFAIESEGPLRLQNPLNFSGETKEYWRRNIDERPEWKEEIVDRDLRAPVIEWHPKVTMLLDYDATIIEIEGSLHFFGTSIAAGLRLQETLVPETIRETIASMLIQVGERERQVQELIVPSENGNPLRAVEIKATKTGENRAWIELSDISHRRLLETRMVSAQRVDALGSLVVGLARSFTDALTAIMGRAGEAKLARDVRRARTSMEEIERHAKNAGVLVQHLLDFAEEYSPSISKVDLAHLVQEELPLLKSFEGNSCTITLSVPTEPLPVEVDTHLVTQSLTNLIANARDSLNSSGGEILISLDIEEIDADGASMQNEARPGRYARLRVRDTGRGMTSEVLSRAFEPLFTTKSAGGKAGLGLSTVHSIVRAHNGFLTAESKTEKGTVVSLYLPLVEQTPFDAMESATVAEEEAVSPKAPQGKNQRVLVLDDHVDLRNVLTSMLNTLGYKATACSTADEAVTFAKSNDVHLLVIDDVMAQESSTELLNQLRTLRSEMKALFLTPSGRRNDGDGHSVLRKPFDLNELGAAVHQAIERGAEENHA